MWLPDTSVTWQRHDGGKKQRNKQTRSTMSVSFTGYLFNLLFSPCFQPSLGSSFKFDGRIRERCHSSQKAYKHNSPKCQTTVSKLNGRAIVWLCESICFEFSGSLVTCRWHNAGKSPVTSLDSLIYSFFFLFFFRGPGCLSCSEPEESLKPKRGLIKHNRKCCVIRFNLLKGARSKKYINFE